MKVGLLVIASEVLDGKITDTNTKNLADFLRKHHLELQETMTTRDSRDSIFEALKRLASTNDVVVTSGGLGPTKDDITKDVLAEFTGRKIHYSPEAENVSVKNYERMGRVFPGKDHGYCYLPENFTPLSNSTGFAPCFYTKFEQKFIISGPGVPREFKSLLEDHFLRITSELRNQKVFIKDVIARTKKVPEEKIFGEVDPFLWNKLEAYGTVSSLPFLMGVDVGVKVVASTQEELDRKCSDVRSIFEASPLKEHIWHFGPELLEEVIFKHACSKDVRFGFAESATGGLCSNRMTNVPGCSKCFMGSVISYDEKIKTNILGVDEKIIAEKTAVSPECAIAMADGLREKFNLDIAISVTGYAGPDGDQVGLVFVGRSSKNGSQTVDKYQLKGDRETLKHRFSQAVLFALLEELEHFA